MLPRQQLHRPLVRLVAPAWRPATNRVRSLHFWGPKDWRPESRKPQEPEFSKSDGDSLAKDGARSQTLPLRQEFTHRIDPSSIPEPQEKNPPNPIEELRPHDEDNDLNDLLEEIEGYDPAQGETSAPERSTKKGSLFAQLFPWETEHLASKPLNHSADSFTNTWVSQLFPDRTDPPRITVADDSLLQEVQERLGGGYDWDQKSPVVRARALLKIEAVSKNLLESDFLRMGLRGKHVDGWVGGILKVIQDRNPDTLEPRGQYFILFDSHAAAEAYKDNMNHHWRQGKAYLPGARYQRKLLDQPFLPAQTRSVDRRMANPFTRDQDIQEMLRRFTIVGPGMKQVVTTRLRGDGPLVERLDEVGGYVERLARRTGTRFLVHVRVEGGRLTRSLLRNAIQEDERLRNLKWRIKDLRHGILAFGKSHTPRLQTASRAKQSASSYDNDIRPGYFSRQSVPSEEDEESSGREEHDSSPISQEDHSSQQEDHIEKEQDEAEEQLEEPLDNLDDEDEMRTEEQHGQAKDTTSEAQGWPTTEADSRIYPELEAQSRKKQEAEKARLSFNRISNTEDKRVYHPRFVIPFEDAAEAHRFVRCWHRREVAWNRKRYTRGIARADETHQKETRLLNVTLMW